MAKKPYPQTSLDPTFEVPIWVQLFPRKTGCSICGIYDTDPEAWAEHISRLLRGDSKVSVRRWLNSRGHDVSDRALYRHYAAHLEAHLREVLVAKRATLGATLAAQEVSAEELDEALGHGLLGRAVAAMQRMDLAAIAGKVTEPGDAIEMLDKLTKLYRAVADVNRAKADTDLKASMVELRELELLARQGDMDALVERYIRRILPDLPAEEQATIIGILRKRLPAAAGQLRELAAPDPKGKKGAGRMPAARSHAQR